jgi:hydrophobe/amphiphile efflux-3 (HAE3) family protein
MQRFLATMAVALGRRAKVTAVLVAVVTIVLGFGATRLEFASGQDSYLNSDDQVAIDNEKYQSLFGGQAMLTVWTAPEGSDVVSFFTRQNLEQLADVERRLGGDPNILGVITPQTALQYTENLVIGVTPESRAGAIPGGPAASILLGAGERDPRPEGKAARTADTGKTLERFQAIPAPARTFDNPEWVRFLLFDNAGEIRKSLRSFFPDPQHAQMVVRLVGNADVEREGAGAEAIVAAMDGRTWTGSDGRPYETITTGAPVLLKDINDYLKGGFLTLGGLAVGIMVVILLVGFAVRWRLLPLAIVLIGTVWTFGLAGFLGISLSVITIAGLPVLLGVGIDFAIQMHSRVEEEVVLDRAAHPIQETAVNLVPALIVATVAAMLAFLALNLSKVPGIREFGILLALGIVVICIASVVLTTSALGYREYRKPTTPGDYTHGPLGRFVVVLGALPRKAAVPLLVLSVLVFGLGVAFEGALKLQTDPEKWVNQDTQVVKDIQSIREETGASTELGIFIEDTQPGPLFTDEVATYVHEFAARELAVNPTLITASSLVTTVSYLMEVPGGTPIPPTGANLEAAYAVAPEAIKLSTVNEQERALNLIFRDGGRDLADRAVVVDRVRETADAPPGLRATPSGLAVVGVGLLENLEANRVLLTYVALGLVFLWLLIRFRNIAQALLSLVPVLIAVGAASLVAAAAGLELSPLTAVGGPLVIALCTEFTALILMRYLEERDRGEAPREAVDTAAARTGRAFVISALTAVTGVAVLAFSSLPLLRDFGLIVALNVAVALLSALVVLPPLLVWADERGWVHRVRQPTKDAHAGGTVTHGVADLSPKSAGGTVGDAPVGRA